MADFFCRLLSVCSDCEHRVRWREGEAGIRRREESGKERSRREGMKEGTNGRERERERECV